MGKPVAFEANAELAARAVNSHAANVAALKAAAKIIKTARQYFPKSIKNSDTFALELTNAEIGKALRAAGAEVAS